jgi:hypothetical protein
MKRVHDDSTLDPKDVPESGASWGEIARFAQTFDGYQHFPDSHCADLANRVKKAFPNNERIVRELNLYELRACLFFEERRFTYFEREPTGAEMHYLRALVAEISLKSRSDVVAEQGLKPL